MTSIPLDGSGLHSIYTGRTTSWPMVASTCVGAVLIVVMGAQAEGASSGIVVPLLLVGVGALLNVLTASSVRATAGPNGVTVRWGIVGWPRCTYRLSDITGAEVVELRWWRVSWGLWWTPRRTSCTVRSGPTVRITLANGRVITVTVPEPALAVEAINQALVRRPR